MELYQHTAAQLDLVFHAEEPYSDGMIDKLPFHQIFGAVQSFKYIMVTPKNGLYFVEFKL